MRQHQRMLCRIANRTAYHPHVGRRFNSLVVQRKSWGYWFVARVAGMPRVYFPIPPSAEWLAELARPYEEVAAEFREMNAK